MNFDKQEFIRLYLDKSISVKDISIMFSVSTRTVNKRARALGLPSRITSQQIVPFDAEVFSKMYLNKKTPIKEIAQRFNIKPRTVWKKARQLNLKIRSEKKYIVPEIGKRFNRLVFLKEQVGTGKRKYWLCQCDCGKIKSFPYWGVFSGLTISCGCYQKEMAAKRNWKGYGDISGKYWSAIKAGARDRNIKFSITIQEAWDKFLQQKGKCVLSGLDIEFSRIRNKCPQTASLDRVDNSKGYIKENIQWLHKDINLMKHCLAQSYFLDLCGLVSRNNSSINFFPKS